MKEIANNVFMENGFAGVTLGAVLTPQGVIMIDAPLYAKDFQSWRTTLTKSGSGMERLLVVLDEHYDRTIGTHPIRFSIIAHEKTVESIASRHSNVRMPVSLTGSEWEDLIDLNPLHWINPEITFSSKMSIEWGNDPVMLEFHPGPTEGSIWVILPKHKVAFVGDAVTPSQPPFLASANIDVWIETLNALKLAEFREYLIISGRGGLATKDDIKMQIKFLKTVNRKLKKFASINANQEAINKFAFDLSESFHPKNNNIRAFYETRLRFGITQYFRNHYGSTK